MGIYQDIIIRIKKRLSLKKVKYEYKQPHNFWRYIILTCVILSFVAGSSGLLLILDPYSIYGRIITTLIRPLILLGNNLTAFIFNTFKIYAFPVYSQDIVGLSLLSIIFASVAFLVVTIMAFTHGRLYCNLICPVGSFLGIISRASLFQIELDKIECIGCGKCSNVCKANCIDVKNRTVDVSRCVSCFNCLNVCVKDGIKYKFSTNVAYTEPEPSLVDESRRNSLKKGLIITGSLMMPRLTSKAVAAGSRPNGNLIMPPGAGAIDDFNRSCIACQLCITKCPSRILEPASFEYGFNGLLQPIVAFKNGYCNYNCKICSDVCPTNALSVDSLEEKRLRQIGIAELDPGLCVVTQQDIDCGACAEHCPTQAVRMVPYKDGLTRPELDPQLCMGCGGCEFICHVGPVHAIRVHGLERQSLAEKPQESEEFKDVIDDFGF